MTSRLTEDVRAQLSSRMANYHSLSGLSLSEAKAILQRAFGDDVSDEVVAQIDNLTGGIHRHIEMIIPRILELRARNWEEIESGAIKISALIALAGSRLIVN